MRLHKFLTVTSHSLRLFSSQAPINPKRTPTTLPPTSRLAVLCILDGWGWNPNPYYNAVLTSYSQIPTFTNLLAYAIQRNQFGLINASEKFVGLPAGQIGNSEVGHMNLGAGRVVMQTLPRINASLSGEGEGDIDGNVVLEEFSKGGEGTGKRSVELMGLVSPGGVHSHQDHIIKLAEILCKRKVDVNVHAFTDGRDVAPRDAIHSFPAVLKAFEKINADCAKGNGLGKVKVVSVSGRYYAMDRDNRVERIEKAYETVVLGKGPRFNSPLEAIQNAYDNDISDEFIPPCVIGDYQGLTNSKNLQLLCANFRADRVRQILKRLLTSKDVTFGTRAGLVKYSAELSDLGLQELFPERKLTHTLGEICSAAGLKQIRVAETEKYPHVTFFFNGGREVPFENEERILVASPKVATYDLKPEMSAPEVTDQLVKRLQKGDVNLVILNYANGDMVGHTGVLSAAQKAVRCVDQCLGKIVEEVKKQKGTIIVTADHGNCEKLWDEEKNVPHTAHTLNKVPVIVRDFGNVEKEGEGNEDGAGLGAFSVRGEGALCDIAPTLLEILGLPQPKEMTGKSLISY